MDPHQWVLNCFSYFMRSVAQFLLQIVPSFTEFFWFFLVSRGNWPFVWSGCLFKSPPDVVVRVWRPNSLETCNS